MGLKSTLFGSPLRTVLTLGGSAAVLSILLRDERTRAKIMSAVKAAELSSVRLLMPKGTEYIADLAFELGPKYDVSPLVVLGITYAESNFGRGLKPVGSGGTGDFIARGATRCVERNAKGVCTKTLAQLVAQIGFPVTEAGGKLKPTTRGWGHGLYQIDLQSHWPFISTGKWADPREAMEYMLKLYTGNRAAIRRAFPNIGPLDLLRATIASYNAGAGAVISALRKGVPANMLDKGAGMVTYGEGYVEKIMDKAKGFEPPLPTV